MPRAPTPGTAGAEPAPARSLASRLISANTAVLLARNTIVSCFVLGFGLAIMWALVEHGGVDELTATAISFLLSNSLHYVFGRTWIFRGTHRGIVSGYAYFLINIGIGLALTMFLFAALTSLTPIHYLTARVLVSVVAGLATFLLNAILNFRRI